MKMIDREIRDLERRMAYRRHEIADTARAAKARTTRKLLSPAGLATAAGVGFLVTLSLLRRKRRPARPRTIRIREEKPAGKIAGALSLLMPVVVALIRTQFGSPAGMAQAVLRRIGHRPVSRGPDRRRALRPPVHPAP